jgi:murein L,D-transpeptidase YafK
LKIISREFLARVKEKFPEYINQNTLKSTLWFTGGILVFIAGVIIYGIILNIREVPLDEAMREKGFDKLVNTSIIVERKTFTLNLYEDSVLIKSYRANFGRNVNVPKCREGDQATPVGEYFICSIDTAYRYHKFFKISYPNLNDAAEGLRKGIITQKQFDDIKFQFYYGECPDIPTPLGNNIGIQGIGEYNSIFKNLPFVYNWTDGSIALTNENIDELYSVVKKGTKVVIK